MSDHATATVTVLPQDAGGDAGMAGRARAPVTQTVLRRIQAMLQSGGVAPGRPLPSQRKLAKDLQVSRASLREALSILNTLGLIRIEQGRGTFVVASGDGTDGEATGGVPGPWRFAAHYAPEEVYQFRLIAEPSTAALAARHVTGEQIAQLERNLHAFKAAARRTDLVSTAQLDFEFHQSIASFSRNRLLADLLRAHYQLALDSQRLPLARRDRLWEAVVEHERILESLSMRDPEGAAYYMRLHIHRAADRFGVTIVDGGT
jgi:GntR family transcriptional regulator, transcriptional repressor for pyruvate dehydrogenase complex